MQTTPQAPHSNSVNLIGMAYHYMATYNLPDGQVDIQQSDTGVIVLILLYFLEQEPSISRTKLEYYILLLDKKCFEKQGVLLFQWYLKSGRIRNFKAFIEFMIEKELIRQKNTRYFELLPKGYEVLNNMPNLCNIKHLLDEILKDWGDKTVQSMNANIMYAKSDKNYMRALTNAKIAIDSHTKQADTTA